jgi:hypothetical protein
MNSDYYEYEDVFDFCDIRGLNKIELLRRLWTNARILTTISELQWQTKFDEFLAKKSMSSYINIFCGRMIQCLLTHDFANPYFYNLHNGKNAFENTVSQMRESCKHFQWF